MLFASQDFFGLGRRRLYRSVAFPAAFVFNVLLWQERRKPNSRANFLRCTMGARLWCFPMLGTWPAPGFSRKRVFRRSAHRARVSPSRWAYLTGRKFPALK